MQSLWSFPTLLARHLRAGVLVSVLAAPAAQACQFHTYTPNPTLVERMLASEHIVLARPDPDDPTRFAAVEALVGSLDGVILPDAVDADTRARLDRTPEGAVLFARDGLYGPWLPLGLVDPDIRVVVDQVVARLSDWTFGGDDARYQMFAGLLDHPNPGVRSLALAELDTADYSLLRGLHLPKTPGLLDALDTPGEDDMRPIRILLAGLSGQARAAPVLSAGLARGVAEALPYLGAYATALIELEGPAAVAKIAVPYLGNADIPLATREMVLEALAIHSQTGDPETGASARAAVGVVLREAPDLAPAVARQFGARADWSQAEAVAAAGRARPATSVTDLFAVNQYIGLARDIGAAIPSFEGVEQ